MNLDRRIALALRRVHDRIELRHAGYRAAAYDNRIENEKWLDERVKFYRRSLGQMLRYQRQRNA